MSLHPHRGAFLLSATAIKNLKTPGWHRDGGGLYLEVTESGAKRWVMPIMVNRRRRDFGLGSLRYVSLQQARIIADDYRRKMHAGVDPVADRRTHLDSVTRESTTFEQVAYKAHAARLGEWKNAKHGQQWINTLRDYAFPKIGNKHVATLTSADILAVLSPTWSTKPETARRLRQRIKTVLEWARAAGHRSGDNPVDLVGHALPKHRQVVEHHQALPYTVVPEFLRVLENCAAHDITKLGFAFLILTATRGSSRGVARIQFRRSGLGHTCRPHESSTRPCRATFGTALAVLQKLRSQDGPELVFVDRQTQKPLSNVRFLNARLAMGYGERCTPHGFRSSFRDWAAEETDFSHEVVEMALAHAISNKTEAAYRRGDLLAERRRLMEAWAAFCHDSRQYRLSQAALTRHKSVMGS